MSNTFKKKKFQDGTQDGKEYPLALLSSSLVPTPTGRHVYSGLCRRQQETLDNTKDSLPRGRLWGPPKDWGFFSVPRVWSRSYS